MKPKLILVTGATGYIASRLIPRLLARGRAVRAMARLPEQLAARPWSQGVEFVRGDINLPDSLPPALAGVHTAYYLVHNMTLGRGYTRIELEGARNFARAAQSAGVQHIIYLGGLADPADPHLAPHLRSRIETGEALRQGRVPVTEFRAGVIAGSGSISFEMIRFMTEALPITIGPAWLMNKSQPIATVNVIDYLICALDDPAPGSRVLEIGGNETTSYGNLLLQYARVRGLKRRLILVPGIPLWFMAMGVDLLTPVPRPIAHALIGGLASDSVVKHEDARRIYPSVALLSFEEAAAQALRRLSPAAVEPVWQGSARAAVRVKHEGFFIDERRLQVKAPPDSIYPILTAMGGATGWPYATPLWRLRGWIDRLLGGPGLRGRSQPLEEKGLIDYYRVETLEPKRVLRLRSELRAPGDGWMTWRLEPSENGSILTQTAFFAPRGLPGFVYWFLLDPLHRWVFRGLIRAIKARSESQ